eukprot:TRINITY_DN37016_c0_g1_i1.p2 TRINITY_DN37016_c0_g1~~TRINITY_DN37016_c0_g1_i1.p2  ORF type:complete len:227 (-),score=14.57 TRINITY_DN37016_c0_g1_i1:50-730(-)
MMVHNEKASGGIYEQPPPATQLPEEVLRRPLVPFFVPGTKEVNEGLILPANAKASAIMSSPPRLRNRRSVSNPPSVSMPSSGVTGDRRTKKSLRRTISTNTTPASLPTSKVTPTEPPRSRSAPSRKTLACSPFVSPVSRETSNGLARDLSVKWAGGGFYSSPEPSAVPLPSFVRRDTSEPSLLQTSKPNDTRDGMTVGGEMRSRTAQMTEDLRKMLQLGASILPPG